MVLSGDGTEFWAPCDNLLPQFEGMECSRYGSDSTHAKQIIEDLDEQAKVTLPTDNDKTLVHRDKEKGNSK